MAKEQAPRSVVKWIAYYKALKNNEAHKNFLGCLSREEKSWRPIIAFYKYKEIKFKDEEIKSSHPWAVPKRQYWEEKLKDTDDIKYFKETTDSDLVDQNFMRSDEFGTKYKKNFDKELLTPHHLISIDTMCAVYSDWRTLITTQLGYNINSAQNIVLLTNSADVACHLEIPLHEGGHLKGDFISPQEYNEFADYSKQENTKSRVIDNDGKEIQIWDLNIIPENVLFNDIKEKMQLKAYHSKVYKQIAPVLHEHLNKCKDINAILFIQDMNEQSKIIMGKLLTFEWELSSFGKDYAPKTEFGCRNVRVQSAYAPGNKGEYKEFFNKNIGENRKDDQELPICTLERDHSYLNNLFHVQGNFDKEKRAELGSKVASELPYKNYIKKRET